MMLEEDGMMPWACVLQLARCPLPAARALDIHQQCSSARQPQVWVGRGAPFSRRVPERRVGG